MKTKLLPVLAIASLLAASCDSTEPSAPTKVPPTAAEIGARFEKILGAPLPKGATNVTISSASLSAEVVDFGFTCSQEEFDALVAAAPKLASAAKPEAGSPYYLSTRWNRAEPKGAQFVVIELSSLGETQVAVDLGTIFLPGVELK